MKEWMVWVIQGIIGLLVVMNSFWIKRWIGAWDAQKKQWDEEGGVVTREDHFAWCGQNQEKCPAFLGFKMLVDWRNGMLEKGGPLTRMEHTAVCKEISKEIGDHFCERLDEMFEHHRTLVSKEFELLRKEISQLKVDGTGGKQFTR